MVGVYGGNDFSEVLTPFHDFNGTTRPAGSELYTDELAEAMRHEELVPAMAQSFSSYKYFDLHPSEMETALQAARDVTTEILATCLRHGVHPIFVYIPPMPDVAWEAHREEFERLAGILDISPAGLGSTERLADSWLAYLRERRVDVLDARELLRAGSSVGGAPARGGEVANPGPGRDGVGYWLKDHHIDLDTHARIAAALLPLVDAAFPPGTRRARRAPSATGPRDPTALLSPGSALEGELARAEEEQERASLVVLERFDEAAASALFDRPAHTVHDPLAGFRWAPDLALDSRALGFERSFPFVTNDRGLRMDTPLATSVDLRIVVVGDEQASGGCPNDETLGGRLAAALRERADRFRARSVEVVNAAVHGHGPHNYLGVVERSRALDPDAFVLTVSSGTDFLDALKVDSHRTERPLGRQVETDAEALRAVRAEQPDAVSRSLESVRYFQSHRPRGARAFELALDAVLEIERRCREDGTPLVVLHVPDPLAHEWDAHRPSAPALAALGLEPSQLDTHPRLAAALFDELEARGLATVRLEADSDLPAPAFLARDLVLSPASNARAAELLAEEVGGALR